MILVVLVFASSFVFAWVIRIACACVYAIAYVAGENQALRWRRVRRGTDLSFYLLVRLNLKLYMHGPLLFGWTNFDKRPLNQQRFSCTVVNLAGFLYIELRVRRAFCTIWPRSAKQRHSVGKMWELSLPHCNWAWWDLFHWPSRAKGLFHSRSVS